MKKLIIKLLALIVKNKLARFQPKIIAVTGSVGKTSTREAIAIALRAKYRVRTSFKNYNNEFGLPLAILGEVSPGKDAWGWLKLLVRAWRLADLPEYLVLEYGADKPGDITYLASIAKPDVAVITAVSPVHLANYPDMQALVEEKASLGDQVRPGGLVVLNENNETTRLMKGRYEQQLVKTYGIEAGDMQARSVNLVTVPDETFEPGETFAHLTAQIVSAEGDTTLQLTNCLSPVALSASLAALQVAAYYKVPLELAAQALAKEVRPVNGRLTPLAGIRGSLIIDDSYNAAPASMFAALDALVSFTPGEEWDRRIAALGDMAELGPLFESEHRALGAQVARSADLFVAVGPGMALAALAAAEAGMSEEKIIRFTDSVAAGRYLDDVVKGGDIILVKGSQSMRMERVVKDIMAEPLRASELLVRQEEYWTNQPSRL